MLLGKSGYCKAINAEKAESESLEAADFSINAEDALSIDHRSTVLCG